jgi:hypothetical protein
MRNISWPFLYGLALGDLDALEVAAFQRTHLDVAVGVDLADVVVADGDVAAQWRGGDDAPMPWLTAVFVIAGRQRR